MHNADYCSRLLRKASLMAEGKGLGAEMRLLLRLALSHQPWKMRFSALGRLPSAFTSPF
jgi:hypothetical protein